MVSSLFDAGLVLFIAVLFLLGAPGLSSRLWEPHRDDSSILNRLVEFSRGVQQNMLGLTLEGSEETRWLAAMMSSRRLREGNRGR